MPFKVRARNEASFDDSSYAVTVPMAGLTLLDLLQSGGVPIKSSCMGKGLCRQCRVKVDEGVAPVTAADRKSFSASALAEGWRLSCCMRPRANLSVFFPQAFVFQEKVKILREPRLGEAGTYWLACDLGTTGVEIAAVDAEGAFAVVSALNRQVQQGADVMTRLEFAQRNGVAPLRDTQWKQLLRLIDLLQAEIGKTYPDVAPKIEKRLILAGNSAVTSFVADLPIEELAVSPYQPASFDFQKVLIGDYHAITLPLLNSFVGGDLFAGLFYLWKQGAMESGPWVLMDVGTNSEIIAWDEKSLFVSSTPAGPAFEGSSISIGMRAESGAVLSPKWSGSGWTFETVDGDLAKGICGSGLVRMIAEAVHAGILSPDGEVLQPEKLFLNEKLSLSQDDVREFQLAKSAIQTGLELVTGDMAVPPQTLYLAGAFGEHLPLEDSQFLELLPRMDTVTLGNASLKGTVLWGMASDGARTDFIDWLERVKNPIELALRNEFQDSFVRNMNLGKA